MDMRYIATVTYDGDGMTIKILDNGTLNIVDLPEEHVPEFLKERIALLRLCGASREEDQLIGRKFSEGVLYVYLSYDEHRDITNFSRV